VNEIFCGAVDQVEKVNGNSLGLLADNTDWTLRGIERAPWPRLLLS
jgi:hypothetical protein